MIRQPTMPAALQPKPMHGQRLFAAGVAAFEGFIQVVGDAGQITGIFQQGEHGEEMAMGGSITDTTHANTR